MVISTEPTTVRLPQELLNRAKRKAAAEGRTLTSLIADRLRMVASDDRKPARAKRVLPAVAAGCCPLSSSRDLDLIGEAADIDAVRRLIRLK